jgi:hypothetical protein
LATLLIVIALAIGMIGNVTSQITAPQLPSTGQTDARLFP